MKKIIILSTFIVAFTICSCNKSPVAHYKYGTITKGEVKDRAQETKLTPQLKKALIELLCIEGMARHEAIDKGYDKNETYQLRIDRQIQPIITKAVNEKISATLKLSWDYVRCRHIIFNGGPTQKSKDAAKENAIEVIGHLKKGADFNSLVKSYSPDPERAVEASVIFVTHDSGFPLLEQAAFSLQNSVYSSEPLILENGSAVVLIADKRGVLTLGDLPGDVKSAKERNRLTTLFEADSHDKIIKYLEESNNGSYKVITIPSKENEVIFSINAKDYMVTDLNHHRDIFSGIIMEPLSNPSFMSGFAREWYVSELYKAEADKKGYLKDKAIALEIQHAKDFILANDYIRYACEKEIVLSENDLLNEYNKNKNHYYKKTPTPTKKPIQLSYQEAKVFVRKNLLNSRISLSVAEWKRKALAESDLVIEN
jgi:parvulin-like peptidyl-prolyl isomerase